LMKNTPLSPLHGDLHRPAIGKRFMSIIPILYGSMSPIVYFYILLNFGLGVESLGNHGGQITSKENDPSRIPNGVHEDAVGALPYLPVLDSLAQVL
jgi:hypothetical protein